MANNQYYLKDKKIEIWQGVSSGGSRPTYTYSLEYGGLWAYYRQLTGTTTLESINSLKLYDSTERVIFVINKLPALKAKTSFGYTKIRYNKRVYDILSVDDYDGSADEYKITAEYSSTQSYSGMD